jgi:hypothetical protein
MRRAKEQSVHFPASSRRVADPSLTAKIMGSCSERGSKAIHIRRGLEGFYLLDD